VRYYGWRMVWAMAASTTIAYGALYYSFAVFVQPMEFELGWNRAQTSGAFSLAVLIGGLVAPFIGRILDRRGSRETMSLGALCAGLLLLSWSYTSSLTWLYVTWLLLGVASSATFYDPAFTAVAVWFKRERAKAMLAITLVAGLASTIFVPLDTWLLGVFGWRGAVRVLAILMLLTAPLLWTVLRRHPSDVGATVDGLPTNPEAAVPSEIPSGDTRWLTSRAFWSVAVSFALARTAVAVLAAHLVPLLTERGSSRAIAATVAGAVGVLQLVGRVFFSGLTSRTGLVWLSAATFAVHGLGVLALAMNTVPGIWVFLALYGTTNGAITLTRAALLAEVFPLSMYGRINGAVSLIVALTSAAMPFVAGVLHTRTGNYDLTLWLLVAALGAATLTVLGAGARKETA
jgi:MFS family permease